MATTITDRLVSAENDVNRILETLQDAMIVDDASKYARIEDTEAKAILYRILSLETKIASLKHKWKEAYKKVNS